MANCVAFSTCWQQSWKKEMLPDVAEKSDKKASIAAAEEMFGALDCLRSNGKSHDGICEAALIAAFGLRRYFQKGGGSQT